MTPEEKVRRAKDNVYDHYLYLTSFVMAWQTIWTRQVRFAATDGPKLYLNPDFIATLNLAETFDVILHEAGHLLYGHMWRFPFGNREITPEEHHEYNVAADLALNDSLSEHFDRAPDNKIAEIMMFPGRMHKNAGNMFLNWPKGKDAEFYHDLVKKSKAQQPKQPAGSGEGEDGSQAGESNDPATEQGRSQGDSGKTSTGSSSKSSDKSEAGSEAHEQDTSENLDIPESAKGGSSRTDLPQSFGDVLPHPIMEEGDEDQIEEAVENWKQQVAQSINVARQQGTLPGWLEEIANNIYGQKSKQNWRAFLRRWMNKVVSHGGTTYDKPHRRLSYLSKTTGIIMPANRSRQASKGIIVADVSGSMQIEQANLSLSECEGVFKYFPRCEIDMVMADTRLIERSKITFHRSDFPLRVPITWLGRGGTNLAPAIMEVAKDRSYKWMIVISDMEWDYENCPNPGIPVIWVWTPRDANTKLDGRVPFGTLAGPVLVEAKH